MIKNSKYFLNEDCFCEEVDDSLFLLNTKTGQYHELNEVGKYILNLLETKGLALNEILQKAFQSNYKLKEEVVIEFVEKLIDRGILIKK